MKRHILLALAACAIGLTNTQANPLDTGVNVAVVYNSSNKDSEGVARHYAARRIIPKKNLIGLPLPEAEEISREEFATQLQKPLLAELEKRGLMTFKDNKVSASKLRYLTLCHGVPLKIKRDPNWKEPNSAQLPEELRTKNEAAVDSELAWLPRLKMGGTPLNSAIGNAFYNSKAIYSFHATNGILMVGRIDAPNATLAKRLVDFAINAETNGFWGQAYIDMRGVKTKKLAIGDEFIRGVGVATKKYGLDTTIDNQDATFPKGFPMSHIGVYAGWYADSITGPFAERKVEFLPGAIAYHLHSFSAETIRDENKRWVAPMIVQGATATMGNVYEPFLAGTPDAGIFVDRMLNYGFSLGEAAYASQKSLSWMTTVVGDPMYRPCARHPQLLHQDLQARRRPELAWSHHRVVNLGLGKGGSVTNAIKYLGGVPLTRQDPILLEKLGDLYNNAGGRVNAAKAWGMALQTKQSYQHHKRLLLKTARRLAELKNNKEAKQLFELFIKKYADHPDLPKIKAEAAKL
ncbi:MAG: TIGR03790 family protein [Limisphaerales bacterium]